MNVQITVQSFSGSYKVRAWWHGWDESLLSGVHVDYIVIGVQVVSNRHKQTIVGTSDGGYYNISKYQIWRNNWHEFQQGLLEIVNCDTVYKTKREYRTLDVQFLRDVNAPASIYKDCKIPDVCIRLTVCMYDFDGNWISWTTNKKAMLEKFGKFMGLNELSYQRRDRVDASPAWLSQYLARLIDYSSEK